MRIVRLVKNVSKKRVFEWAHSAEFLSFLRKRNGLIQEDLAKVAGVHLQLISNCERGLCALPPRHFKAIAKLLGIDTSALVSAYIRDEVNRIRRLIK